MKYNGGGVGIMRSDELEAAWAIVTPLLHAIDTGAAGKPIQYVLLVTPRCRT